MMIAVSISEKSALTDNICRLRLSAVNGEPLPQSSPGCHIDLHLPNGMIRQYSLCQAVNASYYEIAVGKEPQGRGGSAFIHDSLQVGERLSISAPKNLFPLESSASRSLLIAAGVGITPVLSMAEHLLQQGADFSLHYCTKSAQQTAYKQRIEDSGLGAHSHFYFSQGGGAQQEKTGRIPLHQVIPTPQSDLHLYVCGPAAFNDAVLDCAFAQHWPSQNIHREYFSAQPLDHSEDQSFEIEINSSGDVLTVPAGQSILNVLEEHGYFIPVACEEGVCGTCLTGLLEGRALHKDVFMTDEEHARMDKITPCCSRASSARLKLAL